MTWLPEHAEASTGVERVFGLRPDLYEPFLAFYSTFWTHALLDPVILELCRLRVAQLLRCDSELHVRYQPALDAGLTEDQIAELRQWPTSPRFTAEHRAVLAFAEQFVIDVEGIDSDLRDAVIDHVDVGGLVALCEALALFDGFCRFRIILGVEADPGPGIVVIPGPAPGQALP